MKYYVILFVLVFGLLGKEIYAAPSKEFSEALIQELSAIEEAMSDGSADENSEIGTVGIQETQTPANEEWFLQNFLMRLRPNVAFEVPGLVRIQVGPELELIWQRSVPEGWSSYLPSR